MHFASFTRHLISFLTQISFVIPSPILFFGGNVSRNISTNSEKSTVFFNKKILFYKVSHTPTSEGMGCETSVN